MAVHVSKSLSTDILLYQIVAVISFTVTIDFD